MSETARKLIAILFGIAWLFAVTFSYYVVHKPFAPENLAAILSTLGDMATAGALLVLSTGIGHRMLRGLDVLPLERLVFAAGIGLGIVSFVTLGLGLAGLLNPLLFWAILLVGLFALRRELYFAWKEFKAIQWKIESRYERLLATFVIVSLTIAFFFALMPPTAWDAQSYHLVEVKVAIEQGRISRPPDIPYFGFPSLVEMLFLAAAVLKGDVVGQLVHFEFLLLTLGAVLAFGTRFISSRAAWLACALIVAVPSLVSDATWAYVDVALVFYAFVAFFGLGLARPRSDWRSLVLTGAFAGFAMGVKYTAAIIPVGLLLLLVLDARSRHWKAILTVCATAGALAMPWYVRNLAFTGNPFYPFLFGGQNWDSFRSQWFSRFGTGLFGSPLALVTAPWDATIISKEGALGYEATIGPLILALLPLLVLTLDKGPRRSPGGRSSLNEVGRGADAGQGESIQSNVLRVILIYSGVMYTFWLVGVGQSKLLVQTRLLFPAFPTLALASAVALDRLAQFDLPQFSLKRFTSLLVGLVLGLTMLSYALALASTSLPALLVGQQSRSSYLAAQLGDYWKAVQFINTRLPKDARVFLLWEPRSYYIQRAVQPDAILDAWPHLLWQQRSVENAASEMHRAGYTHILLYRAGLNQMLQSGDDPIKQEDLRALQDFETRYLRLVYGNDLQEIVTVQGKPALRATDRDPYAIYQLAVEGAELK